MKRKTETPALSKYLSRPHMSTVLLVMPVRAASSWLLEISLHPACPHLSLSPRLGGGRGRGQSSERPLDRIGYINLGVQYKMKVQGPC